MRGIKMVKQRIFMLLVLVVLLSPIVVEARNNPTIRLSIANYDPLPAQPGQFVDVWVSVENIGMGDAQGLVVEFQESPFFELVDPSDKVREIGVLGSFRDFSLKYRFRVSNDVVEGPNTLSFDYSIASQPGVVGTSNLRIDVKSIEVPISISSVRLSPDPIEPGKLSTLTIAVTNPSLSSNIRDVSVRLQLVDNQGGSLFNFPFAPVDSTNKKSINRIQPGQTTEFRFNLVAYPDADSRIYKVPILFSYFDDVGNKYDETLFVSLNVNSEPDLFAIIESTNINKQRRSGEIIFDIVNRGVSDIKLLTVELNENEHVKITSASNIEYLGNLESDDFKSARFNLRISEDVDEVSFPLVLTFRDALNNEFVETIEVNHVLGEPPSNGNGTSTLILIIVIVVVVIYFVYRRRQKRKKLLSEDDD